ncbi:MAG: YbaB/EbfC family nucleoid-associated protein [Elusimicrobia bacterium]|nr:YbaB/EbfC family nucleoid-associated protein [Elusimicrobiota bacterium]
MIDKMKQLWEMKQKMDEIKKELDAVTLESEDNYVKVGISGSQEIKSVTIKCELASADKAKLEAALVETVNRAVRQSQKSAAEKMGQLSDFKLPGTG